MELMQALEQKRAEVGMSKEAFADHLHIGREHYHMMLNGQRPVGEKLRAGVIERFPDLGELVLKSYEAVA